MLTMPIYKDIGEYTEKVVGKLSARTLACVAGGILTSVLVAMFVYFTLGVDVSYATLPVIAASMPFWLAGFWRPRGMKAEKFIPLWWAHVFGEGQLTYRSSVNLEIQELVCREPVKPDRKARRKLRKKGAELYEPSEA